MNENLQKKESKKFLKTQEKVSDPSPPPTQPRTHATCHLLLQQAYACPSPLACAVCVAVWSQSNGGEGIVATAIVRDADDLLASMAEGKIRLLGNQKIETGVI